MPNLQFRQLPEILEKILSKDSERQIFNEFLETETNGISVADEIYARVKNTTVADGEEQRETRKEEIVRFVTQRYKGEKNNRGLSAHETMVLDLMLNGNPGLQKLVRKMKQERIDISDLPSDFPRKRKQAETLLVGKIAADLGEKDFEKYSLEKTYSAILRDYAHDLFYAINNGGKEKTRDFLMIMHKLKQIETQEAMSPNTLKKLVLESLTTGVPLEAVHIKSLRFTYPGGKNLKIIEETSSVEQEGLPGERRRYPSEDIIFTRLNNFMEIFRSVGLKVNLTVIVSDPDIDYCFPEKQVMVPREDVTAARESVGRYIENLKKKYSDFGKFFLLSEFLESQRQASEFGNTFNLLIREANKGGGKYITEKILEARVDEQSVHYSQMFGSYSRDLARYTAVRQIANLLSLSTVFESFSRKPLLIIDGRGFENKLIGGFNPDSVVKFFTKLKDPVEIIKNNIHN